MKPPLPLKIGIPAGDFHADIVFSVCILKRVLPPSTSIEYLRLPPDNPSRHSECSYLLSLGGCYDHSRHLYDYHQPPSLCFPRFTMRMATSGLIYYHFGRDAINKILSDRPDSQLPPEYLEFHYESLYTQFVQEIDGRALEIPRPNQKYEIKTGIWNRVDDLNPHWKTANPNIEEAFQKAIELVDEEFAALVRRGRDFGYSEYLKTEKAYNDRAGKIIEFESFFPCYPYLIKFERDFINREVNSKGGDLREVIENAKVLFMIYKRPTGSWTVRGISSGRGFVQRKKLPRWSVQQVREKTGISDVKFVHQTGLMAIFESRESALKFAQIAVNEP